ncbi:unnamed protein product [Cuscuta campestris]|uniref:Retrotransposon gag domain-containing protein n=1 Tax=Cuscuta campestris TaxID=132261 RepID=A0A484MRA8_9ASTE|nr:unnamed protein product [Cuscuta campestris]
MRQIAAAKEGASGTEKEQQQTNGRKAALDQSSSSSANSGRRNAQKNKAKRPEIVDMENQNNENNGNHGDGENIVNNQNLTIRNLATPNLDHQPLCIQYPTLNAPLELRSGLIQLLPKFHGLSGEDPHKHLKEFHVVCSTMRPTGVPEDHIKLRAFPFSLDATRTAVLGKEICGIKQMGGETLVDRSPSLDRSSGSFSSSWIDPEGWIDLPKLWSEILSEIAIFEL